jgi:prophage regulatory protein
MRQQIETLVGPDAVAAALGVSKQTIRRWWQAGLMPAPMRCGRRAIRWRLSELNAWLEKKENENDDNSRKSQGRNEAIVQQQRLHPIAR